MTAEDVKVSSEDGSAVSLLDYPVPKSRQCPFDPAASLSELRSRETVSRVRIWDGSTPWIVTGYHEVRTLLADRRLSSDAGNPNYPHFTEAERARRASRKPINNLDGPEHQAKRRLVASEFSIKNIEKIRPTIQRYVDELLDTMLQGPNPTDLIDALARPATGMVIADILGVPHSQRERFQSLTEEFMSRTTTPDQAIRSWQGLFDLLSDVADLRLFEPHDDLFSRLVTQHMKPGYVDREEIVGLAQHLLMAGHETSTGMIALGSAALLLHPDVAQELRTTEEPRLIVRAVEELLRWINLVDLGRRRVAVEDIEIGGKRIEAGSGLILCHDVADRDPTVYSQPDELDIHRNPNPHMAFGFGPHQCLGQNLARVELQVVFATLLNRIPTLELAVELENMRFRGQHLVYGLEELPVRWSAYELSSSAI